MKASFTEVVDKSVVNCPQLKNYNTLLAYKNENGNEI